MRVNECVRCKLCESPLLPFFCFVVHFQMVRCACYAFLALLVPSPPDVL